jgi:hypothetical protein
MDAVTPDRCWHALPVAFKFQLVCLAPFVVTRACRYYAVAIRHGCLRGLIGNLEAHLAGGAGDDTEGGFVVARV